MLIRSAAARAATSLVLVSSLLAAGCGGGNTPVTEGQFRDTNLLDVGELLRAYQLQKGKPPKNFADIQAVPSLEMAAPMGFERVRSGDVVVRWEAALPDTGEEIGTTPDDKVLAYVKEAPEKGGSVLLLNRTLKQMTAEEFKAAPKAGTDPAPTPAPAPAPAERQEIESGRHDRLRESFLRVRSGSPAARSERVFLCVPLVYRFAVLNIAPAPPPPYAPVLPSNGVEREARR